ncbi:MAG: ABC transporter ATP-binding protein [Jaaginema sp. PMC 1079.18]|nr:ABC transporter ATP-binding protein [Jaaginema sp. PMC 1080.18]MEC4852140.1 ABC transporter ATP-binding protein [Jaaginema sp. PMC 1079.18]MEC4866852.1 ABC transporter ATP-binding protein [Jaaginema sp. PMC 1078.18]
MKNRSSYFKLIPYLLPESVTIAFALGCTLVFTACWPILAWLSQGIAQSVGDGDLEAIVRICAIALSVFFVQKLAQFGQDTLMAKAALNIALDLRQKLYAHIQTLSLDYFETHKTGDLSYRLTEDVDRAGEVVHKIFQQFIPCILQLLVVLGYAIYLNWQLTLALIIAAPIMGILIGWFGEKIRSFSRRSQNRISDLSSMLVEVFSGIRLVKAFAAEDYTLTQFSQEAESNRRAKYAAERLKAIQHPIIGFLEAVCVLLVFLLGGWQISQGNLTGAELFSYGVAGAMLIDPVNITTHNYNEIKSSEASVDRIFEILDLSPQVADAPDAQPLDTVTGKVEYSQVSFAYEPQKPVLKDLSFLVQPGETIALVGSSGAGKSTIMNLLSRFYDPVAGKILIDGVDIRRCTLRSLRRQIGIVPQETILFSGTIAQNIAFGRQNFDIKAVEAAAKIANAHQFISQFSQGYYTYVGERGVNLSGGQRQRLAIARAVFLNPRILILDEATSALDSESEALVQEALERIMQNRTVFIIAHRLATVRRADRLLAIEQGEIVESGTHEALLAQKGRYAQFYAQQFQEKLS